VKIQEFNPILFTLGNYRKVIGNEFCGTEVEDFALREVRCDPKSPDAKGKGFPVFGSFREFFGTPNVEEKLRDGLLFYKEEFEFLKKPESWSVVKADSSINPPVVLYNYNGKMFCERGYAEDLLKKSPYYRAGEHLQRICELSTRKFKHARFEDVIGIFINKHAGLPRHRLYHRYSGGIGLDEITHETPSPIRIELGKTLAGALKELEERSISYAECQPTNIKYEIGSNRLILSPHDGLCFERHNFVVRDIALVLYTHDWIEDSEKFCQRFSGADSPYDSFKQLRRSVKTDMEILEVGDVGEMSKCWQGRNKVPLPREYQRGRN
jgi:hypothetical protein